MHQIRDVTALESGSFLGLCEQLLIYPESRGLLTPRRIHHLASRQPRPQEPSRIDALTHPDFAARDGHPALIEYTRIDHRKRSQAAS